MRLFIIKGYDELIIKNQINKLIKVLGKDDICDVFDYDYNTLDLNDLYDNLSSLSLFNKIFIIKNFKPLFEPNDKFDVEKFFNKIKNQDWIIILTVGDKNIDETSKGWELLKESAKLIVLEKETKAKITNSVKKRFQKNNIAFTPESIKYFCKLLNYDLTRINNETKKFVNGKVDLTIENIDSLVTDSFEVNVFEICNAVLNNNSTLYLNALKKYWLNNDYFLLINILAQNLIIARNVKYYAQNGFSKEEIANKMKLSNIRVQILMGNKNDLKNINDKINMLFNIHKNIINNKYNINLIKYEMLKLVM